MATMQHPTDSPLSSDPTAPDAEDTSPEAMDPILKVYSAGPTTVVGFGGEDVLDGVNLALCRDEVMDLIREHEAEVIAFDLTGVRLMPSGMLGLLASLRQEGVGVHLYNPSDDVREVLEVTHLNSVMEIHEVDIAATA